MTPPVLTCYRLQTDKVARSKRARLSESLLFISKKVQQAIFPLCKAVSLTAGLEAQSHPHTAAAGIYFGPHNAPKSYTVSTSTHTGSVGKVIGKPGQIVYL